MLILAHISSGRSAWAVCVAVVCPAASARVSLTLWHRNIFQFVLQARPFLYKYLVQTFCNYLLSPRLSSTDQHFPAPHKHLQAYQLSGTMSKALTFITLLLLLTLTSASRLCPCTCVSEYRATHQCRRLYQFCTLGDCFYGHHRKGKICCDIPASPSPTPSSTPKPKGCPCKCTSRRFARRQCFSPYYYGKCALVKCGYYGRYECCDKVKPSPSPSATPTPSPSPEKKVFCPCKCRFGKRGVRKAFKECKFYHGCSVDRCFFKFGFKGTYCCDEKH